MRKADYELIAYQLWLSQPALGPEPKVEQYWTDLVHNMAMALYRDNPNFKAELFIAACKDGMAKWK